MPVRSRQRASQIGGLDRDKPTTNPGKDADDSQHVTEALAILRHSELNQGFTSPIKPARREASASPWPRWQHQREASASRFLPPCGLTLSLQSSFRWAAHAQSLRLCLFARRAMNPTRSASAASSSRIGNYPITYASSATSHRITRPALRPGYTFNRNNAAGIATTAPV